MSIAGISPLLLRAGLRYQLRHRWQALLAMTGIVLGVAVVLAVDLANGAARASFALSSEQLRGAATHRVLGTGGQVPQSLYRSLFTTPGHPPLAPVILDRVRVAGQPGRLRLVGLDIFAEGAFRAALSDMIAGQRSLADWLSQPDALTLSQSAADLLGVQTGDPLTLQYRGHSHTLKVFAIHPDRSLGSRDLLVVDIATAQAITGLDDAISHIDLILDDAALAWFDGRLPASLRLVSIAQQTRGVERMSAAFELNLTAMSLLALLVGLFLIFNAMSLAIVQRRNLLGRLRALGVEAAELSRLVLGEALVLGLVGTLIGIALGVWLGQALTGIVAATVSELYYDVTADAMQPDWASLAKATLLGVGGTLLASWLPARQAARTPPLTTLSRAALEQATRAQVTPLALLGGSTTLLGLGAAFNAPGGLVSGFAGLFILLLGAALLTPLALHIAHLLLKGIARTGVWRLATRDLDRHLSRLSTATAALMVALAASVGVAVMVESMRGAVSDWLGQLLSADLYVAAQGFEDGATLPAPVVEQAAHLPLVSAVSRYRNRRLQLPDGPVQLVAADLAARSRAGLGLLSAADSEPWGMYERGGILVSEPLAHRLGLRAGDTLRLPTPAGQTSFEIAAVFRDYASEHGRVFMPLTAYRRYWEDMRINTLALFSDSPDRQALLDAVRSRLSADHDLVFTAARDIYAESMAIFDRTFRITQVLRYLSLLVAFIGVLSALMALQLERRKEYAVLRALGMTRYQLARLVALQSVLLGLLAALLAIPTGLALAWVLTDAIQLRAFGWSMALQITAAPLLHTLILGLVAALLASLYPAWRAGWHDPAPQLRED